LNKQKEKRFILLVLCTHEHGVTTLHTEWGGLEHCGSYARERKPEGLLRCFNETEVQKAAMGLLGRDFKKPWEVIVFFIESMRPLKFRMPTKADYDASPYRGDVDTEF
jgi:hypothetical protein